MAKQNKKKAAKQNAKKAAKATEVEVESLVGPVTDEATTVDAGNDQLRATTETTNECADCDMPEGEHADSCATGEAATEGAGADDASAEVTDATTTNESASVGAGAASTSDTSDEPRVEEPASADVAPTNASAPNDASATAPAKGHARADARLPPVGTTIRKLDRQGQVRCECVIEDGGIRFDGQLYASLSGAAQAAAKKLGLGGKSQNGYVFWGIEKPPRPVTDSVEALTVAWERFHAKAAELVGRADDVERAKIEAALAAHAAALGELRATVR